MAGQLLQCRQNLQLHISKLVHSSIMCALCSRHTPDVVNSTMHPRNHDQWPQFSHIDTFEVCIQRLCMQLSQVYGRRDQFTHRCTDGSLCIYLSSVCPNSSKPLSSLYSLPGPTDTIHEVLGKEGWDLGKQIFIIITKHIATITDMIDTTANEYHNSQVFIWVTSHTTCTPICSLVRHLQDQRPPTMEIQTGDAMSYVDVSDGTCSVVRPDERMCMKQTNIHLFLSLRCILDKR